MSNAALRRSELGAAQLLQWVAQCLLQLVDVFNKPRNDFRPLILIAAVEFLRVLNLCLF